MITTIAGKELRLMLYSPLSWLLFAIFQFIVTWLFFVQVDLFVAVQGKMLSSNAIVTVTDGLLMPFFESVGLVVCVFLPFLTMAIMSREYQHQTIVLLRSAPISALDIILGKFAALVVYQCCLLLLVVLMAFTLQIGTVLDIHKIAVFGFALCLLMLALSAFGMFFSTLTAQPVVAGLATLGGILLLALFGSDTPAGEQTLLAYLSPITHYQALLPGLISSIDLVYFVLFIGLFLSLSVYRLASEAWPES